jgi:hypothetical protein
MGLTFLHFFSLLVVLEPTGIVLIDLERGGGRLLADKDATSIIARIRGIVVQQFAHLLRRRLHGCSKEKDPPSVAEHTKIHSPLSKATGAAWGHKASSSS